MDAEDGPDDLARLGERFPGTTWARTTVRLLVGVVQDVGHGDARGEGWAESG